MQLQYLGQVGFLIREGDTTLVIDPYLSDSVDRLPDPPKGFWVRNYPPPVAPSALSSVDLVLCTHDHLDHTDPETLLGIAAASPSCEFAGPAPTVRLMRESGLAAVRTRELDAGKPWRFREITIGPVAAAHEDYETDGEGRNRFLGYVLRWGGITIYHAGDTLVTPELKRLIAAQRPDLAILPINGRDAARQAIGVVGNMTAAEAAAFAVDIGCGLVVPVHYDLYPKNGVPLSDFVTAWERYPVARRPRLKAFLPGETIVVG
jgi:L-ascorbate metabolism protein UlaG (beta-lactamase superfamily)